MRTLALEDVRAALRHVMDPEIPACSIVDLGLVEDVRVADGTVEIDLLPTYSGCPALDVIREDVERAVGGISDAVDVRVRFVMTRPWTTDRISPAAREAMHALGITPPGDGALLQIGRAREAHCPYCDSGETEMSSDFGPTPCRSVRYCRACRNPFESFKPKIARG